MGLSLLKSLNLDSNATSSYEEYEKIVSEVAYGLVEKKENADISYVNIFKISYHNGINAK
jgi:hypothetical protein